MADNRKRLYDDKEIGALIQRATEIQKEANDAQAHGLSLDEIEHIAAELGIDPEHLQTAAAELENRMDSDQPPGFWGGPFHLDKKRVVEGAMTEAQWEEIVMGLRRLTGTPGKTSAFGKTQEWTYVVNAGGDIIERTQVTLRPGDKQTTIEVQKSYRGGAMIAYLLSLVFSVTLAGIFLDGAGLSDLINTLIVAGSSVGGLTVARTAVGVWSRKQRQKVKQLTNWLHDTLSQSPSTSAEKPSLQEPTRDEPARVELPDHLEAEETQPVAAASRQHLQT
jgi:hypothetical protein